MATSAWWRRNGALDRRGKPVLELRQSRVGAILLVAGFLLIVLAVASLTILPELLVNQDAYLDPATDRIDRQAVESAENELSRTLLQGVAALGLGSTAIVTWWRLRLSEFEASAGAQGQLAERLARSLDHLASDSTIVRIGGVYGLERIAEQSQFDREPIMRILAGFATERSHDRSRPIAPGDILAAVVALSRLSEGTHSRFGEGVDLRGVRLPGADLSWLLTMDHVRLSGADLKDTSLSGACMSWAQLDQSDLTGADFTNSIMDGCNMTDARAQGLRVLDADMQRLTADRADLSGAMFGDVDFAEGHFRSARLVDTRFMGCYLGGASFREATMERTTIGNCWISGVDFNGCELGEVVWHAADGTGNEWDPANPPKWPDGFEPPERSTKGFWGSGPLGLDADWQGGRP